MLFTLMIDTGVRAVVDSNRSILECSIILETNTQLFSMDGMGVVGRSFRPISDGLKSTTTFTSRILVRLCSIYHLRVDRPKSIWQQAQYHFLAFELVLILAGVLLSKCI